MYVVGSPVWSDGQTVEELSWELLSLSLLSLVPEVEDVEAFGVTTHTAFVQWDFYFSHRADEAESSMSIIIIRSPCCHHWITIPIDSPSWRATREAEAQGCGCRPRGHRCQFQRTLEPLYLTVNEIISVYITSLSLSLSSKEVESPHSFCPELACGGRLS